MTSPARVPAVDPVPAARPAVAVERLTVARPAGAAVPATVLHEVSFSIAPGECLAVVGSSGAGKSVLARTLLGLADPTGGLRTGWRVRADRLEVAGSEMREGGRRNWRALRGSGVALVLQDALQSLDPLRTIEAEVGEALAIRGVPRRARRTAVLRALEAAGFGRSAATNPEELLGFRSTELSGGMRQRALIAAALVGSPRVLVADEPTTALDPETAAAVLDEFSRLRDEGTAILLVSHDLGAVARVADRIAVLDAGRIVETGPVERMLAEPGHAATRALVAALPRRRTAAAANRPAGELVGELVARLSGVTRSYGERGGRFIGVQDADLAIHRGEILGIAGESGAGKTTLARLLAGAERPDSGTIELAAGARMRMIPQDPLATFDPRWRVRRIIEASLARARRVVDRDDPRHEGARTAAGLLERVGLGPEMLDRRPATLSGGERQRVAIARALAARPDILVCDEAVSALDTVTRAAVLELLRGLRDEAAIVFISHDHDALASVSDRTLVMREGRLPRPRPR